MLTDDYVLSSLNLSYIGVSLHCFNDYCYLYIFAFRKIAMFCRIFNNVKNNYTICTKVLQNSWNYFEHKNWLGTYIIYDKYNLQKQLTPVLKRRALLGMKLALANLITPFLPQQTFIYKCRDGADIILKGFLTLSMLLYWIVTNEKWRLA